jgi:polysaccharide export outer membrane protein
MPGDIIDCFYNFNVFTEKYTYKVGDLLWVHFQEMSELNCEQRIRPDGKISLPYIHDIIVAGKTPEELRIELVGLYKKEIEDQDIYILLKEIGGVEDELKSAINKFRDKNDNSIKISAEGFISLPFSGEMCIAGLTISEATEKINSYYLQKNINVSIDLTLKAADGAKVFVLGAVKNPGQIVLNSKMTILELIAFSGGLRNDASLHNVVILKKNNNKINYSKVNIKRLLKGNVCSVDIAPGDLIFIPRRGISRAFEVVQEISNIILFKGFAYDISSLLNNR